MNVRKILIIATRNKGKIKEIRDILSDVPFEIKSLGDIHLDFHVEETGKTFAENAILKAKFIGEQSGLFTLADDSGIEVDALGGRPSVYSARYAEGSANTGIKKLLLELKDVPREKRSAGYRAVIALYIPSRHSGDPPTGGDSKIREKRFWTPARNAFIIADAGGSQNDSRGRINLFEGKCEGFITDKPIGNNGFGYDPIFYSNDLGKTFGQASEDEKNRVSHRALALQKAKIFLQNH